jgi:hypothetical protein
LPTAGTDADPAKVPAASHRKSGLYRLCVYATYRNWDLDATGTNTEDIDIVLVGSRVKF